MGTFVRHVRDLDRQDRSMLERVVGQTLTENQRLLIQVTGDDKPHNGEPVPAGQLPDWCNVYEGLTDQQIDELDQSIFRLPGGRD